MLIKNKKLIESPLVSVIILTFNHENTIAQTIESILRQKSSYPFEIIVGEDCSNDKTRNICIKYKEKHPQIIRLIFQEHNKGLLQNYYDLVNKCRGKYIAQCAGDDFWHNSDKLQLQIDFLEKNSDYGIVHTDYNLLNNRTGKLLLNKNQTNGTNIPEGYIIKELFYNYNISAPTVCYRKKIFQEYVPFNEFIKLNFPMEDWPLFIIMSKYCKVGYLPISTATYRVGQPSVTNLIEYTEAEKYLDSGDQVNQYLCNMFSDDLKYDEKSQRIYRNKTLLHLAYKKNDYKSAKKYAYLLKEDGFKSWKVRFSRDIILFKAFHFIKSKMQ